MNYKCAIIGVGKNAKQTWDKGGGHKIGYYHADAIQALEGTDLISAADINKDNLDAFKREYGLDSGYLNYHEMLAQENLDIVSICTYVGSHARMIIDCARTGVKGIHCEKPFVASPAELKAVREVVEETGVKIIVSHIRRFKSCFIEAKNLIAEGAIGRPVIACGGLPDWDLAEFGSHWIDIIRFILGDPKTSYVMGQARVRDGFGYQHRMEDHAVAYVEFDGGCRMIVDGGRGMLASHDDEEQITTDIYITGTKGSICICEAGNSTLINEKGIQVIEPDKESDPWEAIYTSLRDWMNDGDISPVAYEYAVETAAIYLGAYCSMLSRDRIDLPMNKELENIDQWPLDLIES